MAAAQSDTALIRGFFETNPQASAAGTLRLTPAERAAVEAYLVRLTGNVRDLADRLERLRADLREPASPPSPVRSIGCSP